MIYNPFHFLRKLFVSCLPGWNTFRSFNSFLIFSSTENRLGLQLNLLAGLGLIFCFWKLVWANISSGYIKSVDVFSVEFWSRRSRMWGCLEGRTTCDFKTESTKWWCLCCRLLLWQQCYCTGVVLFCCCIEIKVLKNIPVQGVEAGSPKATCRNFIVFHFQVCITKEFRYFVMRYWVLILQLSTLHFFSVVVLQCCHECFIWWPELICWMSESSLPEII
jgi:hypothetical protein